MSVYPTYQHVFSSWEVYPRIHYFQKRFNDLLVRFNRIIGALPESFRENSVEKVLEKIRSDFDSGLQITVIGKEDIDDATLVISDDRKTQTHDAKESQKHEDAQLSVVVCHIDLESLGKQALKNTTAVIEFAQKVSHPCSVLLLKCDTKSIFSEEAIYEFKNAILEQGKQGLRQEDILIRSKASVLQKRISDKLEEKITDGFSKISSFLQSFESDDNIRNEFTGDVNKSDGVVKAIRDFLQNFQRLKDLRDLTNGIEIVDETFTYRVLHHLCHVIRCAAVPVFARKYNQQLWVCNRLLHEIEFEEALVDSVSRNTQYHLSKIEKALDENKNGKFIFLLYPLQEDMKSTFEDVEKKFSGMQRLSLVTKKMLFETNGYIKQTNLGLAAVAGKESVPAEISDDLRDNLLSIQGVYGLGTIYGKLEVHLDLSHIEDKAETNEMESDNTDNSKPTETDLQSLNFSSENTTASRCDYNLETVYGKLEGSHDVNLMTDEEKEHTIHSDGKDDNSRQADTDMQTSNGEDNKTRGYDDDKNISTTITENGTQNLELIKTEIAEQLKKNCYYLPYTVKCISRKPEVAKGSFEPGDRLLSPTKEEGNFTFGTIGGYVFSREKKKRLYGLTCLHVVGVDGNVYTDNGKEKELFGKYRKGMENSTASFIDIAAVEVTPTLQEKYKNYLEKEMTRVTKVKVSHEKTNDLTGRYVYKFGAATGVTEGTILCENYSLFDSKARSYLIVIDPLAADKKLEYITNVFTSVRRAPSSTANRAVAQLSSGASQLVKRSKGQTDSQLPCDANNVVALSSTASQDIGQPPIIASQLRKSGVSPRKTNPFRSGNQIDTRSSNKSNETAEQQSNSTHQSVALSDTECQCGARCSATEFQSVARSSDIEIQSIKQSSNIECESVTRSSDTQRQYGARVSFTESHSFAQCSHTESLKTTHLNEMVAHSSSTASQQYKQSSSGAWQTVSKSSVIGIQTILLPNKSDSQTITQTLSSDVSKTIQFKRMEVSKSPNTACQTFRKLTDSTTQTVAKLSVDVNQTDEQLLEYSSQAATELLHRANKRPGYEMKTDEVHQNENLKGCNDTIKDDALPSIGRNEIHIDSNMRNMKLNAALYVDEATMTQVSKEVDILDLNDEIQEKDSFVKVNAKDTYANKQNPITPPQELKFTPDVKESRAEGHTHADPNTLVYVRDIHSVTESDEIKSRDLKGVFSRNGDSGAIICTPDPSCGLTCLAVSMLTGGDLEISGHQGLKSLSFTLRKGLDIICKQCDIEFETVGGKSEK